jgi:hypothetical protein
MSAVAKAAADDAEEEGFEPPEPCGSTVFKTAAFDRSATPLLPNHAENSVSARFGTANLYHSSHPPKA